MMASLQKKDMERSAARGHKANDAYMKEFRAGLESLAAASSSVPRTGAMKPVD